METETETILDTPSNSVLPGVVTLIKTGFNLYVKRFWVLTSISALQLISIIIFAIPAVSFGVVGMSVTTIALLFIAIVAWIWLYFWFTLASLEVIRGHMQDVGFKKAFQLANPKTIQFIWLFLITLSVYIGSVTIGALIPGMAIAGIGVASGVTALAVTGMIAAFLLWVAVAVLVSVCLAFVYWVFVDKGTHSMDALVASVGMVRGRFWAVLWRIVATVFVIYLAFDILSMFIGPVVLLFVPFLLSVVYMIYEAVKTDRVAQPEKDKIARNILTVLAWSGMIIVLFAPIMMMTMALSVSML